MIQQRSKNFKKHIVMSSIIACSLLFGAVGAGAETNETSNQVKLTIKSISSKSTVKTVSKKGVITLSKSFKLKTVSKELKPEVVKLIKIYGGSLDTGKTFNAYVNKHISEKTETNYLLGRQYSKDDYSKKIKGTRKVNSKDSLSKYSKALKQVASSKVKVGYNYKGNGFCNLSYEFQPKNYSPMNMITVSFKFEQLDNGKYVLEHIHFY